jgi:hypothetical protein
MREGIPQMARKLSWWTLSVRLVARLARHAGRSKRKWAKIRVARVTMPGARSIAVTKRRPRRVDKPRRRSVARIAKLRSFRKKKSNGWPRSVNKGEQSAAERARRLRLLRLQTKAVMKLLDVLRSLSAADRVRSMRLAMMTLRGDDAARQDTRDMLVT